MRLKRLAFLLRKELQSFNNDNLHRIAISNLEDGDRSVQRWWVKKYKAPLRDYEDHTIEELLIEMFEDYYDQHPSEAQRFLDRSSTAGEWDGRISNEHEERMKKRFGGKVDLKKYQDTKAVTEEEEKRILENLGRNLPGSKFVRDLGGGHKVEGDEFEDNFLGDE